MNSNYFEKVHISLEGCDSTRESNILVGLIILMNDHSMQYSRKSVVY